jgi:type IV pilus assembly protein PilA
MQYTSWEMDNKMERISRGFTLIELMIVIAIVALLVALAVPAYKDYMVRSKVGECFSGAAVSKLAISEYRQTMSEWPENADIAVTASPAGRSQYCVGFQHYKKDEGSFEINVDEPAVGVLSSQEINFQLMPEQNAQGSIDWYCLSRHTKAENLKYLPSNCRCKTLTCAKG